MSRLFAVAGALVASLAVSGGTASARVPAGAFDRAADAAGAQSFGITADDQQNQFVQAVGTPGATVLIAGTVNLNLSGWSAIPVAPGVRIIGDRSVVARGPRIFTTTFPRTLLTLGDGNGGTADDVRISGIRFDGGEPMDPGASVGTTDADGIDIWSSRNVEIDHDEFTRWRGAAIDVQDPGNRIDRADAGTVWVHDNYIHDNQHPTMNGIEDAFGSHHGAGYGVALNNGAYALIERNEFQANRHSVTGDGRPGTGYLVYRNLMESPGLGFSLLGWDHYEHLIDMHGRGGLLQLPVRTGGRVRRHRLQLLPVHQLDRDQTARYALGRVRRREQRLRPHRPVVHHVHQRRAGSDRDRAARQRREHPRGQPGQPAHL
ncbi:right-handed parallel beta-helix repeat-containing protein [Streptomyces sp. NPDC003483]